MLGYVPLTLRICRSGVNIRAGEVGEHTYHPAAYVDPDGGGYHDPSLVPNTVQTLLPSP